MTTLFQFLRLLLLPFSCGYYGLLRLRHLCYNKGIFPSFVAPFPVISVGNIHLGGTGKTPFIDYLVQHIGEKHCIIIARGYKRTNKTPLLIFDPQKHTEKDVGDELFLLHTKYPHLPMIAAHKRKDALHYITTTYEKDTNNFPIALLDDALQHRSVRPSLHIVLYLYTTTLLDHFLLPAGNLRDLPSVLHRVPIIIISKCPQTLSAAKAHALQKKIKITKRQQMFFTALHYTSPRAIFTQKILTQFPTHIILIEGIARVAPLLDYLTAQKVHILHHFSFPDHHHYRTQDIDKIMHTYVYWQRQYPSTLLLTTEKDAVKLRHFAPLKDTPLYVLPIRTKFLFNGEASFQTYINKHIYSFTHR